MSKRIWMGIAGSGAVLAAMLIAGWILSRSSDAPAWALALWGRTREVSLALAPAGSSSVTGRLPLPSAEESGSASVLGAPAPAPALTPALTPAPRQQAALRPFDIGAVMSSIRELAAFGPRGGGSPAETRAADYLRRRLEGMGLQASVEEFLLPGGGTSRNVIARIPGYAVPGSDAPTAAPDADPGSTAPPGGVSSAEVLVLGAHYDTKPPSPGANDNASGCAVLLELAEILHEDPAPLTIEFVFFGAEETVGSNPDHHHFGSRYRVSRMTAAERDVVVGMISVDMIGYGPQLHSRTMGRGPRTLSDALLAYAKSTGVRMTYLRDPGATGWSDHEPYELAGMPVAWIEWRNDPAYHTAGDTADRIQADRVATVGETVLGFVRRGAR